MSTPIKELPRPELARHDGTRPSSEEGTFIADGSLRSTDHLHVNTNSGPVVPESLESQLSPTGTREQSSRLDDDLEVLRAERLVSNSQEARMSTDLDRSRSLQQIRSHRSGPEDAFDAATNPLHEKPNIYRPPEHPSTNFARFFKKFHESSFLVRYFTYITPVVLIILIPLLLGALLFKDASVGGVKLMWFSIWLEIFWLTLWAARILAKCIPYPMGVISSAFTNNSKKWRDMGKQLEVPATLFLWWLAVEISFLPTMKNNHVFDKNVPNQKATKSWEVSMNKVIISIFSGTVLNLIEKIIIQLIAISFHLRTYSDRIDLNKFEIASLTKLYSYSKTKIAMDDSDFDTTAVHTGPSSGAQTPMHYLNKAHRNAREALGKVGDAAGVVAGDFTGKQIVKRTHPHQVILALLHSTNGSQVLARRLYRTFARETTETVHQDDLKEAFDHEEEAEAAFAMFDKDMNGDISMEELESVCVEIGRERKSITASLKDLDSVVSKLDHVFLFVVIIITILILLSLISTSAAGVLTSAGSTLLALSWLFAVTAQEFLQSVIFVFVKHPFDVGDRVTIYGNTGVLGKGDDYFVKEIALLYTEFKKMEGQVVQAPNSYLNTLFILNMRRSGGLAEAIPVIVKFGTTLEQIELLRERLLAFVQEEKREYQGKILTELRDVTEAHSITLNVVFFYKSNWQNELLRLQRRNKFICAMMVCMQDLGFEGPRMRLAGQKDTVPLYYQHAASPPQYSSATEVDGGDESQGPHPPFVASEVAATSHRERPTDTLHPRPATLRHSIQPSSPTSRPRDRSESITAMSKRVDFSLGMKSLASGGEMSDLYDDGPVSRVPPRFLSNSSSRSRARASSNANEDDTASFGRTSSSDPHHEFDTLNRSQTNGSMSGRLRGHHDVVDGPPDGGSGYRNRLFHRSRLGRHGSIGEDRGVSLDDDLERGMMMEEIPESAVPTRTERPLDPRTSTVSPTAARENTSPEGRF